MATHTQRIGVALGRGGRKGGDLVLWQAGNQVSCHSDGNFGGRLGRECLEAPPAGKFESPLGTICKFQDVPYSPEAVKKPAI